MSWPSQNLKAPPVTAGATLLRQHLGAALPGQHSSHLQAEQHLSSNSACKQAAYLTAHHAGWLQP